MESLLIWGIAGLLAAAIFLPYFLKFRREQQQNISRRAEAESLGIIIPQAQFPYIDQSLCFGCGSCVAACPEGDVLGVVYGKAMIINGVRCVGHGHCEKACPVSAIQVGLGDITTREDIPILDDQGQSTVPGLYITGELGGLSLIRNAISQGARAVEAIAAEPLTLREENRYDLIIVGAGPAGLSAALTAVKHKLSYLVVDQQDPGGTILQYPRRKLVMTGPVDIPLYGRLTESEYEKERLLEIWKEIIERFSLNIRSDFRVERVIQSADNCFAVEGAGESLKCSRVVLALGRRGTPRKLGVPGEEGSKTMYQLLDATSYENKHLLIVGGGDSAVEAAIGLARQPGNTVTISYRKPRFFRIKKKNEERIERLIKTGKIKTCFDSQVKEIGPTEVKLTVDGQQIALENDFVFVFAGGIPPFDFLREAGVTFGGKSKSLQAREMLSAG